MANGHVMGEMRVRCFSVVFCRHEFASPVICCWTTVPPDAVSNAVPLGALSSYLIFASSMIDTPGWPVDGSVTQAPASVMPSACTCGTRPPAVDPTPITHASLM